MSSATPFPHYLLLTLQGYFFRILVPKPVSDFSGCQRTSVRQSRPNYVSEAVQIDSIFTGINDYGYKDMQTMFCAYAITGGLPKYLELLAENSAIPRQQMFNFIFRQFSPFLTEGKNLLIEEFGRVHGTYFSILELIAAGKTSRSEIELVMEIHTGAYLSKLESDYALIDSHKPIDAKPDNRLQKYYIRDNFLIFLFRFFYKNLSAVET